MLHTALLPIPASSLAAWGGEEAAEEPQLEVGMLFAEDNSLVTCVNEALAALQADGTPAALEEEWLAQGGDIPTFSR